MERIYGVVFFLGASRFEAPAGAYCAHVVKPLKGAGMRALAALGLCLMVLASCGGGGGGDGGSSGANIAGTWRGTATSAYLGGFIYIAFTITQNGDSISGSYACMAGTNGCMDAGGTITGTISGNDFTGLVRLGNGISCSFTGIVSGNTLGGLYSCSQTPENGTWRTEKS